MPVIGQQAFVVAPQTDKYLSLTNEEYVRKLDLSAVGNNWTKIRIALNYAFANTGGGTLGPTGVFFVGLCSGTAFPFQSRQCVHAVGYCWGDNLGSQSWTWTANAGLPYYGSGFSYLGLRKVGQSILSATVGSATWAHTATGGTLERRGWCCLDINPLGTTQVQPGGKTLAVAAVGLDCYYEQFLYGSQQTATSPFVLEQAVPVNTQTLTPGAGWATNALDSVNIFWGCPNYELRIYALTVAIVP